MYRIVSRAVIFFILGTFLLFFPFGINKAESLKHIGTGGRAFELEYHQLANINLSKNNRDILANFQSKLKPGMMLGFCEDASSGKTRGIFTPPLLQVKVVSGFQIVINSNKMNERISVNRADEELSSLSIVSDDATISIQTLLKKDWINKIASSSQMISILKRIKRTVKISIRNVYNELLKKGLIGVDISIKDFFNYLMENHFISKEQTKMIYELLASNNIFLSERIDSVFELFEQHNIFIEFNTQNLIEILERLGITLSVDSDLFQEIVSKVLISLDFSIDEIISLFRLFNIESELSVDRFNNIIKNLRHFFDLTTDRIKEDLDVDNVLYEISIRKSKLKLEQEVNRDFVRIGDELEYSIRYSNFGEEDASRVFLIQVLPQGAIYVKKKRGKKPEFIILDNGLKCLVWNIKKKLKACSKIREVDYKIRVDDFANEQK